MNQQPITDRIRFLEQKFQLAEDIDAVIEQCFVEHKDLSAAVDVVFHCLKRHFNPALMFLRTFDEDLKMKIFAHGLLPEMLQKSIGKLFQVSKPTVEKVPGLIWYVMPLDMSGETVGSFGMAFPAFNHPHSERDLFEIMNVAAEELDNYFFTIQENRRKHQFLVNTQEALRNCVLSQAVQQALEQLHQVVPLQELLLLYLDEDAAGYPKMEYVLFRESQKLFDSTSCPQSEIEKTIQQETCAKLLERDQDDGLKKFLTSDHGMEVILLDGMSASFPIGKLVAVPLEGTGFSIASKDILNLFAESLRQRLIDFNREKNRLRQNFCPAVVTRLLQTRDYQTRFLKPQLRETGLFFIDIHGFTRFSERSLQTPENITHFLDSWSRACLLEIFQAGGCLTSLVGDSLMALFGPPFFDEAPPVLIRKLLKSAQRCRELSRNLFQQFAEIHKEAQPFISEVGVCIGLQLAPVHLGLIGPNATLMVHGRGVNDVVRLGSIAGKNEILVVPRIRELAEKDSVQWPFDGPQSVPRENPEEPLIYYRLKA